MKPEVIASVFAFFATLAGLIGWAMRFNRQDASDVVTTSKDQVELMQSVVDSMEHDLERCRTDRERIRAERDAYHLKISSLRARDFELSDRITELETELVKARQKSRR